MERGGEGKGKGKGWGDHLPYFPQLASASNTTMWAGRVKAQNFGLVTHPVLVSNTS